MAVPMGTRFTWSAGGPDGVTLEIEVQTDPSPAGWQDYRWRNPRTGTSGESMAPPKNIEWWWRSRLAEASAVEVAGG